jgi:hypothetical protein
MGFERIFVGKELCCHRFNCFPAGGQKITTGRQRCDATALPACLSRVSLVFSLFRESGILTFVSCGQVRSLVGWLVGWLVG